MPELFEEAGVPEPRRVALKASSDWVYLWPVDQAPERPARGEAQARRQVPERR